MKQTGPISRRNGSADSPMCVGATSIIGRASLRLVLIFITAWRLPGSFCCRKYKCNKQINNRTNERTKERRNKGTKKRTNERTRKRTREDRKNERTQGRLGQTDGSTDGWMDGWKDGRMVEKRMNECICYLATWPYHKQ